jgi:hypothetical protein
VNWQNALQRQIFDLVLIMLTCVKRTKIDHYQQNFLYESFSKSDHCSGRGRRRHTPVRPELRFVAFFSPFCPLLRNIVNMRALGIRKCRAALNRHKAVFDVQCRGIG